jgi:hypothetical protein
MNFFRSEEHLHAWMEKHPGKWGTTLSWAQLMGLSRLIYNRRLEIDYRRPTHEELGRAFESLGLTGAFWQL